jgi:hypothetical protein
MSSDDEEIGEQVDSKWMAMSDRELLELLELLRGVIMVAKRVLSEDVGRFGLARIPASILGLDACSSILGIDDAASILGLDDKIVVAFAKLIEDLEEGESKPMLESVGGRGVHLDLLPNIRLIPLHGGKSSEYTEIRKHPIDYFSQIFQPPTIGSVRKKPILLWDDGRDGNQPLEEDKARPFNKKEQWIYVNGMAMTEELAMQNTKDLAKMFDSRVLCVHNPTTGILPDLFECASGLIEYKYIRDSFAEAAVVLSKRLKEILQDDEVDTLRVVGHSQGTILTTCAVEALQIDDEVRELLPKKLHVYLFANCGDAGNWETPYNPATMEYFHNEFDFVSELGRPKTLVDCTFQRAGFYGHMLGEHYFPGFNRGSYVNENGKQSKLYGLIKHKIFKD